jgi:thiol-disulfide isomerase/thioredoxin
MKTIASPALRTTSLLAALALPACAAHPPGPAFPGTEVDPLAARQVALPLQALDGRAFDLSDYRGRALLVLAFTTDHVPCQVYLRHLERVAQAHPEDLAVIALAGDATPAPALRTMLEAYRGVVELHRVLLVAAPPEVRDGTSALGPIERVPTLFFVNRAGVLVRRIEALLDQAALEALVAPALPPRH